MSYHALAVANYFVNKGISDAVDVTPMKLQKLVYFSHGWYLSLTGGEPLIKEKFGAWPFGPVVAAIYKKFAKFSKRNIDELACDLDGNPYTVDDGQVIAVLDKVWSVYGRLPAGQLSAITHQQGSPWQITYKPEESKTIPNELIRTYFDGIAST